MKSLYCFLLLTAFLESAAALEATAPRGPSDKETQTIAMNLARVIETGYFDPAMGASMASFLRGRQRMGTYNGSSDPNELAQKLSTDLKEVFKTPDVHVTFQPKTQKLPPLFSTVATPSKDTGSPTKEMSEAGIRLLKVLEGNIGYLWLSAFYDTEQAEGPYDRAIKVLERTRAMILDLRGNRGGSTEMMVVVASYFFPQSIHLGGEVRRDRESVTQLWTDSTRAAGLTRVPLVIVTDHETAETAEALAYDLQALGRAKVVGVPTAGNARLIRTTSLGLGIVVDYPIGKPFSSITGKNWEGIGVIPDFEVAPEQALEVAIRFICTGERSRASTLPPTGQR